MKSDFRLPLILSVILLSTAAYDLSKWELFTTQTVSMTFHPPRMARLYHPVLPTSSSIWRMQFYDPATKNWDPPNPDVSATQHWKKLLVNSNEEFAQDYLSKVFARAKGAANSVWIRIEGFTCTDFAPTTTGLVWYIESTSSGKLVRSINRATRAITSYTQKAERIAVDSSNVPWIIKNDGNVAKLSGSTWTTVSGSKAREIFMAGSTIYIVSQDVTEGGFRIKKRTTASSSWGVLAGIGGVSVAVADGSSEVYVVTNIGEVYRQRGIPSTFCLGCKAGWQTPGGDSYEGFCRLGGTTCINCVPGTGYVSGSPLKCQACPALCQTCSSSTKCTSCKPNYFLSNGNCKKPCDDELINIYYYPKDGLCRATCEVPITSPSVTYPTCQLCPDYNCQECTIPKFCTLCYSSHFLSPVGHCMSDCESPLVPREDTPGDKRCQAPCGTDVFYDSDNNICRS